MLQTVLVAIQVALGAAALCWALARMRGLLAIVDTTAYAKNWRVLFGLTSFFLAGYAGVLFLVFGGFAGLLAVLSGTIFFFGALFVLLVVHTSRHTIADLYAAKQKLDAANKEQHRFIEVMTGHLLKPVREIGADLEKLRAETRGAAMTLSLPSLDRASQDAARNRRLLEDFIAYTTIGAESGPFKPVAMDAVVQKAMTDLDTSIKEAGAIVTRQPLPQVNGSEKELAVLVYHLIDNAVRFGSEKLLRIHISAETCPPENGAATPAGETQGAFWKFSVSDTGAGIQPAQCGKIFDIFEKFNQKPGHDGTGIGLAICRKIVEHHGGRIWVSSTPDRGSTFFFTLPGCS